MKTIIAGSDQYLGLEFVTHLRGREVPVVSIPGNDGALDNVKLLINALQVHNAKFVVNLVARELFQGDDPQRHKRALQVTKNLAKACRNQGVCLIHLSDDSMFDGRQSGAYRERDKPDAKSKLASHILKAERYVCRRAPKHIVLRTGPLIAPSGDNLFTLLMGRLEQHQRLEIPDEKVAPTPASDVARVAVAMMLQIDCGASPWGIYNYCSSDPTGLYSFAEALVAVASQYGRVRREGVRLELRESESEHNVILNCHKIFATFGIKQRSWRIVLPAMMAEYCG